MRNITAKLMLPETDENDIDEKLYSITSPERLLEIGKEYIRQERYDKSAEFFEKAASYTKGIMQEIFTIYQILACSIEISSNPNKDIIESERLHPMENMIIQKTLEIMEQATSLYSEQKLPKKELSEIERLIDNISFNKMRFSGREEFEKFYSRFKFFCLNADGIKLK